MALFIVGQICTFLIEKNTKYGGIALLTSAFCKCTIHEHIELWNVYSVMISVGR